MSSFTRKWVRQKTQAGTVYRPVIDLLFSEKTGYNVYSFIVDSGADVSLAPRQLAERIGLDWIKSSRVTLTGISPKPECSLEGRIHKVTVLIPDIEFELSLPRKTPRKRPRVRVNDRISMTHGRMRPGFLMDPC